MVKHISYNCPKLDAAQRNENCQRIGQEGSKFRMQRQSVSRDAALCPVRPEAFVDVSEIDQSACHGHDDASVCGR